MDAARRIVLAAVFAAVCAGCSKVPEQTVAITSGAKGSFEGLAREARGAFLSDPRTVDSVELSVKRYGDAVAIRADRYGVLWEAARACLWMGAYGPEATRKDYVHKGIEYANTAVALKPNGQEGLFFHGALAGRLADLDFKYGRDALKIIESRMQQLVAKRSGYLYGGPDRVLALVYMRAPGPPISVGDLDKALVHMNRALAIESHWPENQLCMAELEFKLAKKREDPEKAASARSRLRKYFLSPGANPSMAEGAAYEFKEWQKDARKLLEEYGG